MCMICGRQHSAVESFCDDCLSYIDDIRDGLPAEDPEAFTTIQGYSNYEISNYGCLRNVTSGLVLKQFIGKGGYHQAKLTKHNKSTTVSVPRLVAAGFMKNYKDGYLIVHVDDNKSDNFVGNLRMTDLAIKAGHLWKKEDI